MRKNISSFAFLAVLSFPVISVSQLYGAFVSWSVGFRSFAQLTVWSCLALDLHYKALLDKVFPADHFLCTLEQRDSGPNPQRSFFALQRGATTPVACLDVVWNKSIQNERGCLFSAENALVVRHIFKRKQIFWRNVVLFMVSMVCWAQKDEKA